MHLIATFTKATIVAFVFLPILLFSQIQIGEDITLDNFYKRMDNETFVSTSEEELKRKN